LHANIDKKHNSVLEKISYIEAKIANISRIKCPTEYSRKQNKDAIQSLQNDIILLKTQLKKINPYYKQHGISDIASSVPYLFIVIIFIFRNVKCIIRI
jgi:hypothetical protein